MDLNLLRTTLAGLGVTPPDVPRASLYLTQLQQTSAFLTGLANNVAYAKCKPALLDPELLNGFCEIMDDFIGAAVAEDLRVPQAAYTDYNNYFDINLFQPNGGVFATTLGQFFARYPTTQRAIAALTNNFQTNVQTACQRVITDWAAIDKTFSPWNGQILRLTKIRSSGSDFHKGGQQVLILTFDLFVVVTDNMGDTSPMSDTLQVVYKPSDLEVDCLIAGNTAAVNAVHGGFQVASLYEIMNGLITTAQGGTPRLQTLPVYKILPYNYGSTLVAAAGALPIRTSYGYIEFLEHKHAPGKSVFNYYPFGVSDFKIFPSEDKVAVSRGFYQLLGELAAVASTFSIVDMHVENVIASRYRPNLIDLEISLTQAIAGVDDTQLLGGNLSGIQGQRSIGDYSWLIGGVNGAKTLTAFDNRPEKQNRLWTMSPNQIVSPAADVPANALLNGMNDGLAVIRTGQQAGAFNAWITRLANTVVRYLPFGTTEFEVVMRDIYASPNVTNVNYYTARMLTFISIKYDNYAQAATPQPDFVALVPAFIQGDYLNCDIPVFYHQIGTTGIMDSRGINVPVPANVTVLDPNNMPNTMTPAVAGPLGRTTFFAAAPTANVVVANQLAPLGDGGYGARRTALYDSTLAGLGLHAVPSNLTTVVH